MNCTARQIIYVWLKITKRSCCYILIAKSAYNTCIHCTPYYLPGKKLSDLQVAGLKLYQYTLVFVAIQGMILFHFLITWPTVSLMIFYRAINIIVTSILSQIKAFLPGIRCLFWPLLDVVFHEKIPLIQKDSRGQPWAQDCLDLDRTVSAESVSRPLYVTQ